MEELVAELGAGFPWGDQRLQIRQLQVAWSRTAQRGARCHAVTGREISQKRAPGCGRGQGLLGRTELSRSPDTNATGLLWFLRQCCGATKSPSRAIQLSNIQLIASEFTNHLSCIGIG
jgi:hypothetical protein